MKKFEYESNASSVRYNKTRGKISPSLSLSPLRGEILKRARPIIRRKRLIYRDRRKKKKKRFPNPMAGVLRGTRRGEGLIGIPFLLLGDSEGKRRVDLEASLSTRSLTVCKVCQTGGKEAGGGRTCDGASSSLLSLEYFFSPWRNFSSSSSLFDEKIDVAKKIKRHACPFINFVYATDGYI